MRASGVLLLVSMYTVYIICLVYFTGCWGAAPPVPRREAQRTPREVYTIEVNTTHKYLLDRMYIQYRFLLIVPSREWRDAASRQVL